MGERYINLFRPENQYYQENAPVVVLAGALLKDTANDSVLAQIKFKSVSSQAIKAVKVFIQPLSTVGQPLGDEIEHIYLDIYITRDDEFGQKEAVRLPDRNTRQFRVRVTEVAFEDNTTWMASDAELIPFSRPDSLDSVFDMDSELVKQYRLTYGEDSTVFPKEEPGLWYCACGAVNRADEQECHKCQKDKNLLFRFDREKLEQEKESRLREELYNKGAICQNQDTIETLEEAIAIFLSLDGYQDVEERLEQCRIRIVEIRAEQEIERKRNDEERKQQEELKRIAAQKKAKKIKIIAAIAALAIVVAIIVARIITSGKEYRYNKANELLKAEQYDEEITIFEHLGNYSDSSEKTAQAKYQKAVQLMNDEQYESALSILAQSLFVWD